jgi:hypothetical protein
MNYGEKVIGHNGLGWASPDYKLIYVGIPKTASTSMRHFMNIAKHGQSSIIYMGNLPEEKRDYRTFTIVRDPLNRFVSGVFEGIKRGESPKNIRDLKSVSDIPKLITSFIDIIEKDGFTEVHTAPQVAYFCDKNGKDFKFDKVLVFERLSTDFAKMCEEYDINSKLEHKQKGNHSRSAKALELIKKDENLMNRIKNLYKEDFELYNRIRNGEK